MPALMGQGQPWWDSAIGRAVRRRRLIICTWGGFCWVIYLLLFSNIPYLLHSCFRWKKHTSPLRLKLGCIRLIEYWIHKKHGIAFFQFPTWYTIITGRMNSGMKNVTWLYLLVDLGQSIRRRGFQLSLVSDKLSIQLHMLWLWIQRTNSLYSSYFRTRYFIWLSSSSACMMSDIWHLPVIGWGKSVYHTCSVMCVFRFRLPASVNYDGYCCPMCVKTWSPLHTWFQNYSDLVSLYQ
jgi:hypothetical protein